MWSDASLNRWLKTALASERNSIIEEVSSGVNLITDDIFKQTEEALDKVSEALKQLSDRVNDHIDQSNINTEIRTTHFEDIHQRIDALKAEIAELKLTHVKLWK